MEHEEDANGADWPSLDDLPMTECDSSASTTDSDSDDIGNVSMSSNYSGKRIKKFSYQPDSENEREEMEQEIKRSKETGDCNLSNLKLTAVPNNVPFEALTRLSLSDNSLTRLPSEMFEGKNCKHLINLDVNSNNLESLPLSLMTLKKLEVLLLNHNQIVELPLNGEGKPILPSIQRIGLEFNSLKRFPVELIEQCKHLNELNLTNNEPLLEEPVPLDRLLSSPLAKGSKSLLLRVDNRPRFIQQMQAEKWSEKMPWLTVDLQKVYPDRVLDFLFLGSVRTAQTVSVYHDLDIKFVLTVGRGLEVKIEPGMEHLVLPINDFPEENMTILFQEAFDFIDEARKRKKGVLIHCFAGLSRSVTIAAAYIMKNENMTRDAAMDLIKQARPAARPNDGFMNELLHFEKTLEAQRAKK